MIGGRALEGSRYEARLAVVKPRAPIEQAACLLGANLRERINNPSLVAATKLEGRKNKATREEAKRLTAHMAGASAGLTKSYAFAQGIQNVSGNPNLDVTMQVLGSHARDILNNPIYSNAQAGWVVGTHDPTRRTTWSPDDSMSALYADIRAMQFLSVLGPMKPAGINSVNSDPNRIAAVVEDVMQNQEAIMPQRALLDYWVQFAPPEPPSQP